MRYQHSALWTPSSIRPCQISPSHEEPIFYPGDDPMSDDEPVVLDPTDPAFSDPAERGGKTVPTDVLTSVLDRSTAAFTTALSMQQYLHGVGVTDPAVWSAFRLGAGGEALTADLTAPDWATLADLGLVHGLHRTLSIAKTSGINLPTYDPRAPERVVGVIRLTPAQNQHRFASPPVSIGCAVTIANAQRVVLVDGPLSGLRLAQAGVEHVALVEDPTTLGPLVEWLAGREVVIAAHRHARINAMKAALGEVGARAIIAPINSDIGLSPDSTFAILGITKDAVRAPEPLPHITPQILHDLFTYARDRVAAGTAGDALRTLEADDADLVGTIRIGYLPPDYHDALSGSVRRAFHGQRLGHSIVVPATDEQGNLVDLFTVYAGRSNRQCAGCFANVRGLLGASVLGRSDHLIITDTFRWMARLHRQGYRNVLLVRGPEDAALNAQRIAAAGVQAVVIRSYRNAAPIAAALSAAGITVTIESTLVTGDDWLAVPAKPATKVVLDPVPITTVMSEAPALEPIPQPEAAREPDLVPTSEPEPEPEPSPVAAPAVATRSADPIPASMHLVEVKVGDEVAICEIGPVRYAIELGDADQTTRNVVVRRGHASHQDRINLGIPAQCRRFATSAARRVDLDADRIVVHLVDAWQLVRAHERQSDAPPVVAVASDERTIADALLRDPRLLARITADLSTLGWVGEDRAKGLLYLTAVSRLLPDPLWSVYRATAGAAPWRSLGIIASLMPPESFVVFHRLTEAMLRSTDPRAFKNRLLLVDRAETLRPEGAIALRALREWGSIGWKQVARAEGVATGGKSGLVGDALGPVAVLAAAAGDLDRRCRDCFLTVTVDETPGQTERVLADQRRHHGPGGNQAMNIQAVIRRHHALQRLLRPATVVIPFAERIAFPMTSLRHRDEQAAFLSLIEASAVLHQFQRERERDATAALIASEADFHHAVAVAGHLLGSSGDGLSEHGRHLMQRLFAMKITDFVLSDLGDLITDWTYYTYRACAEELVQMGYCTAVGGGQGRARRYTLTGRCGGGQGITLLPVGSATDTMHTLRPFDTFRGASQGSSPITNVG